MKCLDLNKYVYIHQLAIIYPSVVVELLTTGLRHLCDFLSLSVVHLLCHFATVTQIDDS